MGDEGRGETTTCPLGPMQPNEEEHMKKVTTEVVVRGSAAAVGLAALVSVVGAGVKWN